MKFLAVSRSSYKYIKLTSAYCRVGLFKGSTLTDPVELYQRMRDNGIIGIYSSTDSALFHVNVVASSFSSHE